MAEKPPTTDKPDPPKPYILLVVGGSPKFETTDDYRLTRFRYNWYEVFKGCTVLGRPVQVEMAHWDGIIFGMP